MARPILYLANVFVSTTQLVLPVSNVSRSLTEQLTEDRPFHRHMFVLLAIVTTIQIAVFTVLSLMLVFAMVVHGTQLENFAKTVPMGKC
jgi:hypothetical protein